MYALSPLSHSSDVATGQVQIMICPGAPEMHSGVADSFFVSCHIASSGLNQMSAGQRAAVPHLRQFPGEEARRLSQFQPCQRRSWRCRKMPQRVSRSLCAPPRAESSGRLVVRHQKERRRQRTLFVGRLSSKNRRRAFSENKCTEPSVAASSGMLTSQAHRSRQRLHSVSAQCSKPPGICHEQRWSNVTAADTAHFFGERARRKPEWQTPLMFMPR